MLLRHLFSAGLALVISVQSTSAQDCSVPFVPSQFKARLAWKSAQDGPSALATPVVANMNPQADSMPEIIIAEYTAGTSDKIQFYRGDGSNANSPMILTVPGGFDNYPVPGPTVGDIDGDGRPELIMPCYDNKIRVFHDYTENPTAPMTLWITSAGQLDFEDQRPLLADFDADGIPEIYTGSDIYRFSFADPAAPTLTKVINGGGNKGQAHYASYTEGSCNPTAVDILSVADCNGDPDCAGLELVAGPVIYSIDLDISDGDGYQIKVQRDLNTLAPPPTGYSDGYTAVADINLDGLLDVVVTSKRGNQTGMYIWNKNGLVRFFPYPTISTNSGSLACIANVYDDTQAGYAQDFPEILVCSSYNFTCFSVHAGASTPATPYWWNLPTTDFSGWTGSSVYDFNGDGIAEIVYRDERDFRILYGGGAPFPPGVDAERNWFKTPCWSATSDEYPVVADVDNDGETEIVVTGRLATGIFFNSRSRLHVFESAASPWVPCRNVWNQYNYFVVNVNDDLSIPASQQTHYLELPAPGSGNRPLNRYLSQRPLWNDNYEVIIPLPDAAAQANPVTCSANSLTLELTICNTGDKILHAGTPIAFYQSDPTTTNALLLGTIQLTTTGVPVDSCTVFSVTIPKITGTIFGVVNDNGSKPRPFQLATDFPVTNELECYWLNNIFQFESPASPLPPNLGPDLGICSDTILQLDAGAGYSGYLWQDGSTGAVFQAQQPGQYWVEVTDLCAQKHRDSLWIEPYDLPLIQLDTLQGDCFGHPASVTASAGSAYGPLTYQWSTSDTTATLSGLADGMYTVTVTNAKGCTATNTTWVEAGGNLQAAASIAAPILCFGEHGDLQLDFTAGRPPYIFTWSNGGTTPTLPNVPAGDYAVTVTDADLCVQVLQISLPQPDALLSAGLASLPACPGIPNGAATFSGATQGTPPYTLLWSNNESTPALSGLAAGTYQLTITDANGCTLAETTHVSEFPAPVISTTTSDVSCFGENDGQVSVAITGGTPGFAFLWSNNSTLPGIDHVPPGDYALTLTYAGGQCTQTFDFQIREPLPILLSASSNPAICNGGAGGSIDLAVQHGITPLTFIWSNGDTTEDLADIETGVYQVTVTDASGCVETYSQAVDALPAITLGTSSQAPLCAGGSDGAIQLAPGGGVLPFQVNWSNGGSGISLSGLPAGNYTATVTDAAACTAMVSIPLTEPLPLLSAGAAALSACPGLPNGAATFLGASQGTPPYTLIWSTNASTTQLTDLAAGVYLYTVTDAHGCSLGESVTVPELLAPVTDALIANVSCSGNNDGNISVTVLSGSPGFGFLWSDNSTEAVIDHLPPGNYSLALSYADGKCTQTFDYQIQSPSPVVLADTAVTSVLCFGQSTGAINLAAEGGTPPYQFLWSSGQQTASITSLAAGHYLLTLTDGNGCTMAPQFEVLQPPALVINPSVHADTCQTASGAIFTTTTGGVAPYQFSWSNFASGPNQTGLSAGQYDLTLTDAHGCTHLQPVPVPVLGTLPQLTAFTDTITCVSPATIGVSADQNNLHYTWSAPDGVLSDQATHTVLTGGLYQVTVANAFGCQSTVSIPVPEDTGQPVAEAGPPDIQVSCNETSILLSAAGSSQGGMFSNHWTWLPHGVVVFDTAAVILPVSEAGWYMHTVVNNRNGCVARDSILVDWDEPIHAAFTLDSIRCFGDDNGAIRIGSVSGGTPPFYYSIDNLHFTTQSTFHGLPPGDYPVRVRDDFGCRWETTVALTEPAALSVVLTASDTSIELGQYVQLNALPMPQGTIWSDITWEPVDMAFESMALRQRVKPETHTEFIVRVKDHKGCVAEDRVWVSVYNHHIYVPNVILPGSEQNGGFTLFGGDGVVEMRLLRIYDRWGELLFERRGFPLNDPELGWDGSYQGQPLNPGVFVWYAEVLLQDGRILFLKGDVTVVR